jgi:hypothetical protein
LLDCEAHSVGFHSDESRTFHNEGNTGSKYAEVNDVIGCDYCSNTGQVFFTMNGNNLAMLIPVYFISGISYLVPMDVVI